MVQKVTSSALLLFCVGYLASAAALPFGSLMKPGIGFMPVLVGSAGVALAGANLLAALRNIEGEAARLDRPALATIAQYIAVLFAYVAALPWAGFLPATFVAVFAMLKVARARGYIVPAIVAAGGATAFSYVFKTLLYVPLP